MKYLKNFFVFLFLFVLSYGVGFSVDLDEEYEVVIGIYNLCKSPITPSQYRIFFPK